MRMLFGVKAREHEATVAPSDAPHPA